MKDNTYNGTKLEKLKEAKEKINLKIKGLDNVDQTATNIFVANHSCLKDGFYLPMSLDYNIVSVISPRLLYKKEMPRQEIVHQYLYGIPIEAHGGKAYAEMGLANGCYLLKNGISLSIFPEGAYIKEDEIHRGRTGAARLLFDSQEEDPYINFIPVAIDVSKEEHDLDCYQFLDDDVTVTFLPPIDYKEEYRTYINTNESTVKNECLHQVVDNCMSNIADSLGKTYINEYIELRKRGNVVFSNGVLLPTDIAQEQCYYDRYSYDLEMQSKKYIKEIRGSR